MNPVLCNVMKVCDIERSSVSQEAQAIIEEVYAYKDTDEDLREHLYGMEDIASTISFENASPEVKREIADISQIMEENEASYIRLITQ